MPSTFRSKPAESDHDQISDYRTILRDLADTKPLIASLRRYYGNQKIERVERFISWLEKSSKKLLGEFEAGVRDGEIYGIATNDRKYARETLACWLGVRYMAYLYKKKGKQSFPPFHPDSFGMLAQFSFSEDSVWETSDGFTEAQRRVTERYFRLSSKSLKIESKSFQSLSDIECFIAFLNAGMHEGTHALSIINGGENILSEVATSITQSKHSFPLKNKTLRRSDYFLFSSSTRQWQSWLNLGYRDVQIRAGEAEYLSHILAPWIKRFYLLNKAEADIFSFSVSNKAATNPYSLVLFFMDFCGNPSYTLKDFFEREGIKDVNLKNSLVRVFTEVDYILWGGEKDVEERSKSLDSKSLDVTDFIDTLEGVLRKDRDFGTPKLEPLPDGFSCVFPAKKSKESYFFA